MDPCATCRLVKRRDDGLAPAWDRIRRTAWWDVVHSYGTSVEGWLVLVLRRHATAVADLTDDEAAELGPLARDVSLALHRAVGCEKTYVVQFAEHPDHPHVHVHVIARDPALAPERRGPGIFADDGTEVSEARRSEIAALVDTELARIGR